MQINVIKLTCFFSICFITACAPPKLSPELTIENKQLQNNAQQAAGRNLKKLATAVSSWEISGAIAAREKAKGWSASLNWLQQGPDRYQIRLFGPLGGGTVIIEKQDGTITYVDGPKKFSSHSADELLQQQTGIRLPVSDLYYWVRGMPAPGSIQASQYENAHLVTFKQGGYTIDYANYTTVSGVDLPGKIQLQGHGAVIKLVIKKWRV